MLKVATFAAGCYWGTEHMFRKHYPPPLNKGISKTSVGFTKKAEALRIEYDPDVVSYAGLVEFFYRMHDPTTLNSQGADRGREYRSAIFYHDSEQQEIARRVTKEVQASHFDPKGKKIVTEISEAGRWDESGESDQLYLQKNPQGYHCPTHHLYW